MILTDTDQVNFFKNSVTQDGHYQFISAVQSLTIKKVEADKEFVVTSPRNKHQHIWSEEEL